MDELQGVQALDYWNNPANLLTRLGAQYRDDGEGNYDWYLPTDENPNARVRFDENGAPILNEDGRSGGKFYDEDLAQRGYARNDYIQWADTVGLTQDQAREYIYGPGSTVVNDPRLGSLIKAGNRDSSQWQLPVMSGFGNSAFDNFLDGGGLIKLIAGGLMPSFGIDFGAGTIGNAALNSAIKGGTLGALTGSENILGDALAGGVAGGIGAGMPSVGVTNPALVGAAQGAGGALVKGEDPLMGAAGGAAGSYLNEIFPADASWGVNPRPEIDMMANAPSAPAWAYGGSVPPPSAGDFGASPVMDSIGMGLSSLGQNFGGAPATSWLPSVDFGSVSPEVPAWVNGGTVPAPSAGGGFGSTPVMDSITGQLDNAGAGFNPPAPTFQSPSGTINPAAIGAAGALAVAAGGGNDIASEANEAGAEAAAVGGVTQGTPAAAGAAAGAGLLKKFLDGAATADDWAKLLGMVGGSAIGAYGANQQADAYRDVANKYFGMGQPYRDRLNASYDPNFKASSIAGFDDAINSSSNAILRKLSTQGNPYDNPGGLMEATNYVTGNVALPAINTYRSQLGTFGQLGTNQAGAASGNAIQSDKGVLDSLSYGLRSITQPENSIDDILNKMRSAGVTFNVGKPNNGVISLT